MLSHPHLLTGVDTHRCTNLLNPVFKTAAVFVRPRLTSFPLMSPTRSLHRGPSSLDFMLFSFFFGCYLQFVVLSTLHRVHISLLLYILLKLSAPFDHPCPLASFLLYASLCKLIEIFSLFFKLTDKRMFVPRRLNDVAVRALLESCRGHQTSRVIV